SAAPEMAPALVTPEQQRQRAVSLGTYKKDLTGMRKSLTSPNTYPGIY
ncbi:MAG: hypothetical protein HY238_23925, partial [Acidobacteria bacterium]|nr:hypothetical protein [Acidobacteriota bacterium]